MEALSPFFSSAVFYKQPVSSSSPRLLHLPPPLLSPLIITMPETTAIHGKCCSRTVRLGETSSSVCRAFSSGRIGGDDDGRPADGEEGEVEEALRMDEAIPRTSDEFVKRVSSRAYDMRRQLKQILESSSYDVLEANPWRESPKTVYVLTHGDTQLCTMKTRRNRSEVERELGMLFSKKVRRSGRTPAVITADYGKRSSSRGSQFRMLVEDVTEGVLIFEDEQDATRYCDLLQGSKQGCESIAEVEASSVFELCKNMRALAVLFRRGMTPPLPETLEHDLRSRKSSLEDQEELN